MSELLDWLARRHAFAACLQETWRLGNDEPLEEAGFTFVGASLTTQTRRGSQGVAIVLSRAAAAAWRAAGSHVWRVSSRVIAVRLLVRDPRNRSRSLGVLLVSGYAPVSTASAAEWAEYYNDVTMALSHRHSGDVVVFGTDGNASIGRGSLGSLGDGDDRTGAVGPHGLEHMNVSGRRLRTFLETNGLAALSSFFRKPYYGTWLHPCSKCMHQLDQMVVSRPDVFRFTDSGSLRGQSVDSDHRAVGCKLRIAVGQQRKVATERGKLTGLDFSSLRGRDGATARHSLACSVLHHLGLPKPPPPPSTITTIASSTDYFSSPIFAAIRANYTATHGSGWWNIDGLFHRFEDECRYAITASPPPPPFSLPPSAPPSTSSNPQSGHTQIDLQRPSLTLPDSELPTLQSRDDTRDDTWAVVEAEYAATLSSLLPPSITYAKLATALSAAAQDELPRKTRRTPGWFAASAPVLRVLIDRRDAALDALHRQPKSAAARALLNDARNAVKMAVRAAKSAWIEEACKGASDASNPKEAWDSVKKLRAGLAPSRRAAPAKMKKADGSLATTAEENAEVFAEAFEKLYMYGRTPTFLLPSMSRCSISNVPKTSKLIVISDDHTVYTYS